MFTVENPAATRPMPNTAKKVFTGHIFDIWQWEQELYDGSTAVFERARRPDYAYMIGVLPDQRVLLVEDEQPDRGSVLTAAGGKVDPNEDPERGAQRELLEETGYAPKTVVHWHTYQPSGKTEYLVHAFIGRDATKVTEPELEGGERISVQLMSFDDFIGLGMNPKLRDWMLRIKLLEAQIDPKKKEEIKQLLYGSIS